MKIYQYDVTINNEGKVIYAVDREQGYNIHILYPYEGNKYAGWNSCPGRYTPKQFRPKLHNEIATFCSIQISK